MTTTTAATTKQETKHTIHFWIVVSDDMRRFGYQDLEAIFSKPTHLDDLDECREYTAEVPESYVIAPGKNGIDDLWDKDSDMSRVVGLVNPDETMLATRPIDKIGLPRGNFMIDFHIQRVVNK